MSQDPKLQLHRYVVLYNNQQNTCQNSGKQNIQTKMGFKNTEKISNIIARHFSGKQQKYRLGVHSQ